MRFSLRLVVILACVLPICCPGQSWTLQSVPTKASLRGLQALNSTTVWASGTEGTWVRSVDNGSHWQTGTVPGAQQLDFRGLHFFDAQRGLLLSSGPGEKSRIYSTEDGGAHWTLRHTNTVPSGFYDAIAFWDRKHGIVLGDPVDGLWTILLTKDGGQTWTAGEGPPAAKAEGAFAASNSCLTTLGSSEAYFATGGPGGANVWSSNDRGASWHRATTPIRNDLAGAGIFSLAWNGTTGVAVGGLYTDPAALGNNWAVTNDSGLSWHMPPGHPPNGYRSAVAFAPKRNIWIAIGTSGSDLSTDARNWKRFDSETFHALSATRAGEVWASGPGGRIAKLR